MSGKELPFDPCPFLNHPHQQTVFSTVVSWLKEPISVSRIIPLRDGDKVVIEVSTPDNWKPTDPTVFCVHGLCGSHQSPYQVRLVNRLVPMGIRVIRFNMRCCGSGRGMSRNIYHGGRCDDLFEALKIIKAETPNSDITLIGFSLGGNIVLKLLGDLGSLGSRFLKQVIAVSPPVDLANSADLLHTAANGMYEKYFCKIIRKEIHFIHKKFKELPPVRLPKSLTLRDFDEIYTVPRFGFPSVDEYYHRCSAKHTIEHISVPCKILLSEDDPIVSSKSLDGHHLPSHIGLFKTKKGGHMGYLGNPSHPRGFYWLDSVLEDWIFEK